MAHRSNYAKVHVWHNDPRGLESTLTDRSFKIEILHRFDEKDAESAVENILIDGSIGDVVHLLRSFRVDRIECAAKDQSTLNRPVIDTIPFSVIDTIEHLKTDPKPITCLVTDTTRSEILDRLQLWQKDRDE